MITPYKVLVGSFQDPCSVIGSCYGDTTRAGKVFRKHSDITTVEIHVWIGTLSGAPDEDLLSDVLPCMLGCLHVVLVTPGRPLLIDL